MPPLTSAVNMSPWRGNFLVCCLMKTGEVNTQHSTITIKLRVDKQIEVSRYRDTDTTMDYRDTSHSAQTP